MQLPNEFMESTRAVMGDERFEQYLEAFRQEAPVSIRLNPMKTKGLTVVDGEPVPWCRGAYYLPQRPNFTMDPLLHAGCYYVQEAASMFLDEVIRQVTIHHPPSTVLDLCAAPGGKSTLLRAALPEECVLYSNEPIRQRANILSENVQKWGYANHIVTNNYPKDYRRSKLQFDLILCDVPCSGEGMFRKDEATIREWSPQNVEKCWRLQRDIVSDAWECLAPGGILIYSTCTFNTKENEENIRWILSEYDDAEVVSVDVRPEWHITGSLLPGFDAPVYRFIPGISRGEGLFLCVLHKKSRCESSGARRHGGKGARDYLFTLHDSSRSSEHYSRTPTPPCPRTPETSDLDYKSALSYLRGEALILPPETPRGIVTVTFMGHPLGEVKNIGTRANNLFPKEWRIRTTHIPSEYEPIIKQI